MSKVFESGGLQVNAAQLSSSEYIQAYGFGGERQRVDPIAVFNRGDQMFEIVAFQMAVQAGETSRSTTISVIPQGEITSAAAIKGTLDTENGRILYVSSTENQTGGRPCITHIGGLVEQTAETLLTTHVIDNWVSSPDIPGSLSEDAKRMYRRLEQKPNGLTVVKNRFRAFDVSRAS